MSESLPIVSLLASLVSLAGVVYIAGVKLGRVQFQVDEMWKAHSKIIERVSDLWEFNLRRGNVELVHQKLAEMNSPIVLKVNTFEKILPFLREFLPAYVGWLRDSPGITDPEIAELFEKRFGQFIMEQVCIPMGLSQAGCLSAIVNACKLQVAPISVKEPSNASSA